MNLRDTDLNELFRQYSDVVTAGCERDRLRAMFAEAARRSAANIKPDEQLKRHDKYVLPEPFDPLTHVAHLPADAFFSQDNKNAVIFGAPAERALASAYVTVTEDSMRAQAFVRDAWLRLALEDQPKPEPELTPAERTWQAHKGFTR